MEIFIVFIGICVKRYCNNIEIGLKLENLNYDPYRPLQTETINSVELLQIHLKIISLFFIRINVKKVYTYSNINIGLRLKNINLGFYRPLNDP